MVSFVFGAITIISLIVLFSQGLGAALFVGAVLSIMGLLFCLPWIVMGDRGGRESGE